MNSLEFIEKEIEHIKEFLSDSVNVIGKDTKDPDFWEERLRHLQQIKTILEAWEVVFDKTMGDDFRYEINIYKCDKDYEKFNKAFEMYNKKVLEVDND